MKTSRRIEFLRKLLETDSEDVFSWSATLVSTISTSFELKAASFYSYDTGSTNLTLRAQVGLSYDDYHSFELPLNTPAGEAFTRGTPGYIKNVADDPSYRDRDLIKNFSLKELVTVPATIKNSNHQILEDFAKDAGNQDLPALGVLCLYPKDSTSGLDLLSEVTPMCDIIGAAYVQSLSADLLKVRALVMAHAVPSKDPSSFSHRVCDLLRQHGFAEGASLWIHDSRSDLLRLSGSTGLETDQPKPTVYLRPNDESATRKAFADGNSRLIYNSDGIGKEIRFPEAVDDDISAAILIPIREPDHRFSQPRTVGVLRAVNKIIRHDEWWEVVPFSWEDRVILEFIAEIVGVIFFAHSRNSQTGEEFERAIHGTSANLNFVRSALKQLVRRAGIDRYLQRVFPARFSYSISDCIDTLDTLDWQINRFAFHQDQKLSLKKVSLVGDVLSKILPFMRQLERPLDTKLAEGLLFRQPESLSEIPFLRADADALGIVFKNLAENAMKYSIKGNPVEVRIEWRQTNKFLHVSFFDFGIGIEDDDLPFIFSEGFEAENARRRCSLGCGYGLFQSRLLMEKMGGNLSIMNNRNPTTFVVSIPLFSRVSTNT